MMQCRWGSILGSVHVFALAPACFHFCQVSNLSTLDSSTAQVFNCQMGRGRTTTGTVVATLLAMRRWSQAGTAELPMPDRLAPGGVPGPAATGTGVTAVSGGDEAQSEEALRGGQYVVIRSLVRVLEGGVESKQRVDEVINRCSAMQVSRS